MGPLSQEGYGLERNLSYPHENDGQLELLSSLDSNDLMNSKTHHQALKQLLLIDSPIPSEHKRLLEVRTEA